MDGDADKTTDKTGRSIKNNSFMHTDEFLLNPINLDSSTFINTNLQLNSDLSETNEPEKGSLVPDSISYDSSDLSLTSSGAAANVHPSTSTVSKEKQPTASVSANTSSRMQSDGHLKLSASAAKTEIRRLANTDCTEKIVLCIDLSSEMNKKRYKSRAGASFSAIELVKKALKLFVYNKILTGVITGKHQFAIVLLVDQALWLFDFTSSFPDLFTHLEELQALQTPADDFDMSTLFDVLIEKAKPPTLEAGDNMIPPYIVRVILIYGRSHCTPVTNSFVSQNLLMSSPCFFMDIVYLNEPPADSNLAESIFHELCELDDRGTSYVFDVSKAPTKVFDAFAKLIGHPLQRVPQKEFGYCLEPILVYDDADLDQYGAGYTTSAASKSGYLL